MGRSEVETCLVNLYIYGQLHVRRNQPSTIFLKKWNFLGIQTCRA